MIKLLLILTLALALDASRILNYNIYDRTDRVDIMITFDTPYTGAIKQSTTQSKITIKLEDASIESSKSKELSSNFLYSLGISSKNNNTRIIASVPSTTILKASKTSDGYGLRLRFSKSVATQAMTRNTKPTKDVNPFAALPTKQDNGMQKSYYIVVAILIIGIIILFLIRKKMLPIATEKKQSSWLFQDTEHTPNTTPETNSRITTTNNVSIRFQKTIDDANSVVMLDFGEQSYLVLMGKSNILLDKFTEDKPVTEEDFETILQNRHQELEQFMNGNTEEKINYKEPLQAYKERAASIIYES